METIQPPRQGNLNFKFYIFTFKLGFPIDAGIYPKKIDAAHCWATSSPALAKQNNNSFDLRHKNENKELKKKLPDHWYKNN